MTRRSVLFSPGDRPEMLRKAPETGADVIVFDLEDAVAPDRKPSARESVFEVLAAAEFDPACEVLVRVNPLPAGEDDLDVVLSENSGIDGLVLPKVNGPSDVEALSTIVQDRGYELPVFALVETAAGVLHAEAIADVDATDALVFGAEDLTADIGATRSEGGEEVSYARQHIVLAARAAGIDVIDTLSTAIDDRERVHTDAQDAVAHGFDGKLAIHPAQVEQIHAAFVPDDDSIEWARRVLAASDRHDGVFELDGQMVDGPLIRQAERIMERTDID